VKFIGELEPKCFLFENVVGMMRGRWTTDGKAGEIWEDVRKAFENLKKYDIAYQLLQAKSYGVPQNRPRIILVGIRHEFMPEENPELPAHGFLPKPTNNYHDAVDLLSDLTDPQYLAKGSTEKYLCN